MVAYETIVEPEAFRTAIAAWRNEPQLWLDTEVADWFTKTPMLSLLQVRNAVGRKWVVDVIEPNMRVVLEEEFIPQIMANDRIEKWAHYARFERKFLGQERVKNLNCTFERARSIPYYRLPLRSLSLAALADHFCKIKLDKTFQKADWGTRPLKPEQLEYAASDTEWCYRIYDELRKIPSPPDSSKDKPVEIEARYVELLGPWNMARAERQCIRDAVEEFMIHRKLSRHSRFSFSSRKTYSTDLTTLINFAQENDPGECADLRISLSERLRSLIGDNALEQIRPLADIRISQTFRGPRAPRLRDNPPSLYKHARDAVRVTRDYEKAEHNLLVLASEKDELRDRMRNWMEAHKVSERGKFRFSKQRQRWKVDCRLLGRVLVTDQVFQIPFPRRLWLGFPEPKLKRLIAAGQSTETPVLRWLARALSVGLDAQQSRDWEGIEEGEDGEE